MQEEASDRRRSLVLFVATLFSMMLASGGTEAFTDIEVASSSLAYTGALMSILLAHELAHYVVARRHGFATSLPMFIPLPFGFGSLGAIIFLRSQPPNRTALLEMGAAGPLAGAVVAFLMLAIGLQWTGPDLPVEPDQVVLVFQDPWAVKLLGGWVAGEPPGRLAELHPVALAGWIGCLLTAINLIPLGQADGGHVLCALLPRWAVRISRGVLAGLVVAGFVWWPGWALWAGLAMISGAWRNLEVPRRPRLTRRARWISVAVAAVLALTFMRRPMELVGQRYWLTWRWGPISLGVPELFSLEGEPQGDTPDGE